MSWGRRYDREWGAHLAVLQRAARIGVELADVALRDPGGKWSRHFANERVRRSGWRPVSRPACHEVTRSTSSTYAVSSVNNTFWHEIVVARPHTARPATRLGGYASEPLRARWRLRRSGRARDRDWRESLEHTSLRWNGHRAGTKAYAHDVRGG